MTITHETNVLVPEDGIQSKYHAPRVGIIQIGSVEPASGETLALVKREKLSGDDLREVREEALKTRSAWLRERRRRLSRPQGARGSFETEVRVNQRDRARTE